MITAMIGIVIEARRASDAERRAAQRSAQEIGSYATWSIMNTAESITRRLFQEAFAGLSSETSRADESLPSLSRLLLNMNAINRRRNSALATIQADTFFRFDARTNELSVADSDGRTLKAPRWLRDSVLQISSRFGSPFTMAIVRDSSKTIAVVLTTRRLPAGKITGAFGFAADARLLSADLFGFMDRGAYGVLPTNIARGLPNDSLVAALLSDQHGQVLWSTRNWRSGLRADTAGFFPRLASLVFHVAIPPEALGRLSLVAEVPSRLPFLIVLLIVIALLGLLVVRQMRREYELARVRAEFTAGVSHELRTPLAQILLYGETLSLGRIRSDTEGKRAAEVIVTESRRLMHLVENALHFASSDRNVTQSAPEIVHIGTIVQDVIASFESLARADDVILSSEIDDLAKAHANTSSVRQILLNLLDNAMKYGPRGQTICVCCAAVADRVVLSVEDQGPGVPVAQRRRIWESFVRAPVEGRSRGGSGIGLAVVRDLAYRAGALVSIDDAANGQGAKFSVAFLRAR